MRSDRRHRAPGELPAEYAEGRGKGLGRSMRGDPNRWLNLTIVVGLLAIALVVILRGGGGTLPDIIAGGLLGYLARELPRPHGKESERGHPEPAAPAAS